MASKKRNSRKPVAEMAAGLVAVLAELNRKHLRLTLEDVLELAIALRGRGRIVRLATLAHFIARKRQQVVDAEKQAAAAARTPSRRWARLSKAKRQS